MDEHAHNIVDLRERLFCEVLSKHPAPNIDVVIEECRKAEAYVMGTDVPPPPPVALPAEAVVHDFDEDGRMIPKGDHAEAPVPVTPVPDAPHTEETAKEHHAAPVPA